MFKVNNKNSKMTSKVNNKNTISIANFEHFTSFCSVPIVDFKQVYVSWEKILIQLKQ